MSAGPSGRARPSGQERSAPSDPSVATQPADPLWYEVADAVWLAAQRAAAARHPVAPDQAPPAELQAAVAPGDAVPLANGETGLPQSPATAATRRPDIGRRDAGVRALTAAPLPAGAAPPPIQPLAAEQLSPWSTGAPGTYPFAEPPLPGGRSIARALRPFKRQVESRRGQLELDEEATAHRAAQDGLWLPECRPAHERWLDLVVVIDDSRFAALHRPQTRQFVDLVVSVGAFRTVRVYLLDTEATGSSELTL